MPDTNLEITQKSYGRFQKDSRVYVIGKRGKFT